MFQKNRTIKRCLFVVHRRNIAIKAMKDYSRKNLETPKVFTILGDQNKEHIYRIFSDIQTISRDHDLKKFDPNHFEYIIIDETNMRIHIKIFLIILKLQIPINAGMSATSRKN